MKPDNDNTAHNRITFNPSPDLAVLLNHLLDIYERRGGQPKQVVRVRLSEIRASLPGYYSQLDPTPRLSSNEQLIILENQGWVQLSWQAGQKNHLLEALSLSADHAPHLYTLLKREPLAERRQRLRDLLLADRFRFTDWRYEALTACLTQLKAGKSPAPFSLTDKDLNRDLLAALIALPDAQNLKEIPYRVFSVRVFNDSKRFERLKDSLARLARRHHSEWHTLSLPEILRELGLVANPGHLYFYGPWQLVDTHGQQIDLASFYPSVGLAAELVAGVQRVSMSAPQIVCVENLASFYELIRYKGDNLAAFCLWGNPSPAARHLLSTLAQSLSPDIPLQVWADIDYGGLNILAQLRRLVSRRFIPYRMDVATLEAHAHWAHPLTPTDQRNLKRLRHHPYLTDMTALIDFMLQRELKLEQEALGW